MIRRRRAYPGTRLYGAGSTLRGEVLEAETGKAALEKLPEGVDLVLPDYRLPNTDGGSVLRRSRNSI